MDAPEDWGPPRQRTVEWYDPAVPAEAGEHLAGRAYIERIADGTFPPPPIASLLGFRITEVGDGDVRFTVTPDESVYNPIGVVHGGLACTILDSVAGCAVHTTLPPGSAYTSLEIKVSYLRAIHATSGELVAHGWVTKPGRRAAFAEADLRDADGRLLATASSTCLVMTPTP